PGPRADDAVSGAGEHPADLRRFSTAAHLASPEGSLPLRRVAPRPRPRRAGAQPTALLRGQRDARGLRLVRRHAPRRPVVPRLSPPPGAHSRRASGGGDGAGSEPSDLRLELHPPLPPPPP